jgi:phosphate/sulfate permease
LYRPSSSSLRKANEGGWWRWMAYLLIALLGAACGVLLTWYLLIPIVTIVAVAAGVAGAVKGQPFGDVLTDTALIVSTLEASWLASAFAAARFVRKEPELMERADQSLDLDQRTPEHEG